MSTTFIESTEPVGTKTHAQVRRIYGLARDVRFDDDDLHQLVEEVAGVASIRALSRADADRVIARLGGEPLYTPSGSPRRQTPQPATPRRTVQYRRQRTAARALPTAAHLDLMRSLAARRNMSEEGLTQLCRSVIKRDRPVSTHQTNKIVEALKAMNRREGLL